MIHCNHYIFRHLFWFVGSAGMHPSSLLLHRLLVVVMFLKCVLHALNVEWNEEKQLLAWDLTGKVECSPSSHQIRLLLPLLLATSILVVASCTCKNLSLSAFTRSRRRRSDYCEPTKSSYYTGHDPIRFIAQQPDQQQQHHPSILSFILIWIFQTKS